MAREIAGFGGRAELARSVQMPVAMRQVQAQRRILGALVLASMAGCDGSDATTAQWRGGDVVAVGLSAVAFNPKLRADLVTLDDPAQANQGESPFTPVVKAYLDEGSGGGITSELSLTRTGEFKSIPLRNAECLWVAPADEVKLHWESIARLVSLDSDLTFEPGRDEVGTCTYTDPFWRELIGDLDGNEYPVGPAQCEIEDAVRLRSRVMPDYGPFFNPDDDCFTPQAAPVDVLASVDWCATNAAGDWPNCNALGCAFNVGADTQHELSTAIGGVGSGLIDWGPIVKRVSGTRQLVRRLEFDPYVSNPNNPKQTAFSFIVDELSDGRWAENFSANLRVTRFRVFGLSPQGHRVYLDPSVMQVGATECNASLRGDYSVDCPGAEPSLIPMTPTYLHDVPDKRLLWRALFADEPRAGGFTPVGPCCEGTQAQCCDEGWCPPICSDEEAQHGELQEDLFIEFTVVDLQHLAPDLFTSPSVLDFGPVEWGSSWHHQVSVENTGGMSVTVEGFDLDESKPGAFAVQVAGGGAFPQTIAPSDTLLLDVRATSNSTAGDEPTGTLTVQAKASDGTPLKGATALRYLSYSGPQAVASYADFEGVGQLHLCTDADRHVVLVSNFGHRPLDRSAYRLEGPDTMAFTLKPYDGTTLDETTLAPGAVDVLYVQFQDDGSEEQYEASLVFDSNARNVPGGRFELELVGFADEADNVPSCWLTGN